MEDIKARLNQFEPNSDTDRETRGIVYDAPPNPPNNNNNNNNKNYDNDNYSLAMTVPTAASGYALEYAHASTTGKVGSVGAYASVLKPHPTEERRGPIGAKIETLLPQINPALTQAIPAQHVARTNRKAVARLHATKANLAKDQKLWQMMKPQVRQGRPPYPRSRSRYAT